MPIPMLGSPGGQTPGDIDLRLKRVLLILGVMAIVAGFVYAVRAVWPAVDWALRVLSPFLIALVLAYVFNPVVSFVQQRMRLGRVMGLVVVAGLLTLLVVALLSLLVVLLFQLNEAFAELRKNLPVKLAEWNARLSGADKEETRRRITEFVQAVQQNYQEIARSLLPKLREGTLTVAQGIATGVQAIFSLFSLAIFVTLITFYFLLDFSRIPRVLRILVPDDREEQVFHLLRKVDEAVGGYLRGQLMVCGCMAVMTTVLMLLVGPAKWAFLIGCLAGGVHFIPYLGPIVGATPGVVWALFNFSGWDLALRLALIVGGFAIIQSIDGLVLSPRIVGKHAHLHPLAVLLALLVGAQFGIGGMIVAVPIACVARVLLKELWWDALADQYRRTMMSDER